MRFQSSAQERSSLDVRLLDKMCFLLKTSLFISLQSEQSSSHLPAVCLPPSYKPLRDLRLLFSPTHLQTIPLITHIHTLHPVGHLYDLSGSAVSRKETEANQKHKTAKALHAREALFVRIKRESEEPDGQAEPSRSADLREDDGKLERFL